MHFFTSNQISTYRKLNLILINNIYVVFFPLEMQRRPYRQKYTTHFLQKKNKTKNKTKQKSQTFKNRSCEKLFLQSVCYWYKLLRYFLFYVITGRILFFLKVHLCSELFLTAMLLLSLKKVALKKSVIYTLSPQ